MIGAVLAASGLAGLGLRLRASSGDPATADIGSVLPPRVGPWTLGEADQAILPPADDFTAATYDQIIAKRYTAPDRPTVTIVIAYGPAQSYATQLHRPELCYPASNFNITRQEDVSLELGLARLPANYLEASRGERQDAVLYWTRIGDRYPQNLWQQRRHVALSALRGEHQDGVLVRLSSSMSGLGREQIILNEFAKSVFDAIGRGDRKLLFGSVGTSGARV